MWASLAATGPCMSWTFNTTKADMTYLNQNIWNKAPKSIIPIPRYVQYLKLPTIDEKLKDEMGQVRAAWVWPWTSSLERISFKLKDTWTLNLLGFEEIDYLMHMYLLSQIVVWLSLYVHGTVARSVVQSIGSSALWVRASEALEWIHFYHVETDQ